MTDIRNLLNATERREYDEAYGRGFARGYGKGIRKQASAWLAEALLLCLEVRRLSVTQHQREQIFGCQSVARLDHWLGLACTATSVGAILRADPSAQTAPPVSRRALRRT